MKRRTFNSSIAPSRLVGLLAVYLLFGLITSVVIAWLAPMISDLSYDGEQWIGAPLPGVSRGPEAWQCRRASGVGHEQIAFTARVDGMLAIIHKREGPQASRTADLPFWTNIPNSEDWWLDETYLHVAAGWPLRCFVSQCRERDVRWVYQIRRSLGKNQVARLGLVRHRPRWKNALVIKDQTVGGPFSARVIPLKPIPVGIVVNTLFWGVLWFTFVVAARRIRGRLRVSRGRCYRCAYDLRGDSTAGCPECGWRRQEASSTGVA